MPSPRKRIGFLPSSEVQIIIDKICNQNKLSQSKVTGILVKEALSYRGILNSPSSKVSLNLDNDDILSWIINTKNVNIDQRNINKENLDLYDGFVNDEVQMIKDYIEFKLFKKIMNKNLK